MPYTTNSDWLNKTPNKSPGAPPWVGIIVHETASPNPDQSSGTLNFNLDPEVASSYHDLIGRDGTRYRYVDPEHYISWHAGKNTLVWVDSVQFEGGEVNGYLIGIEIDGRNDGTRATDAQLATVAAVLNEYGDTYGFPRDAAHLIMHSQAVAAIDPSYKSDARCTTIAELISLCNAGTVTLDTYTRLYRVRYDRSVVRTGPGREFPIVGYVDAGREFMADNLTFGEPVDNWDGWLHSANGIGFLHESAAERIEP